MDDKAFARIMKNIRALRQKKARAAAAQLAAEQSRRSARLPVPVIRRKKKRAANKS